MNIDNEDDALGKESRVQEDQSPLVFTQDSSRFLTMAG